MALQPASHSTYRNRTCKSISKQLSIYFKHVVVRHAGIVFRFTYIRANVQHAVCNSFRLHYDLKDSMPTDRDVNKKISQFFKSVKEKKYVATEDVYLLVTMCLELRTVYDLLICGTESAEDFHRFPCFFIKKIKNKKCVRMSSWIRSFTNLHFVTFERCYF